ncbi:MAG: LemA family protein [Dehalococcoidales bacterium]|jgi:hypothetical protein
MNISVIIGAVIALACLFAAFRFLRKKRLVDDMPTSKTLGVFIGLAELKGTAESDKPLTSYLAGMPCVLYTWKIEEHWSRTVTSIGAKGVPTTRHESGWTVVAKDQQKAPFYLKDDTGVIRIIPDGAEIQDKQIFNKTCRFSDPLYFAKGPLKEIADSDHERRFTETAIPLHANLYIMGQARQREDIVAAEIAKDKNCPMFLVSTRTEKQISSGLGFWFWGWLVIGLLAIVGGVWLGNIVFRPFQPLSGLSFLITVGGYLLIIVLGWMWLVYNSLINLRQRVQQGWFEVDIELKRRNDLIPNLVQVVEGYSAHESTLQELVANLRQQLTATPPGVAGPDYAGFMPTLRAAVESYPDLKASDLFLKLQDELSGTEQRIALARDYFNQIVTFYNTRLEIIPDTLLAKVMRLKPQTLMGAAGFERAPVKVVLAS